MKKTLSITISLLVLASPLMAEPAAIGTFSYLEGRVDRKASGGFEYLPVSKDDAIFAGDVLRTKGDSRTEISFGDASVVKLGENSQLQVKEYGMDGAVRQNARLVLDRGVLRAIVSKSATGQQNFSIDTPNSTGSVKGSDIGVSYLKSSSTFLAMSGAIEARHAQFPDKAVLIEKGKTAFVPAEAPAQDARPFLAAEAEHFRDDTAPLLARDANVTSGDISKAIVTDTLGDVRVKAKGSAQWHRAALKEILGEGDEVETGENGGLRMVLESGRVVELGANTQLSIDQFKVDAKTDSREDLLSSKRGEIRARIDKLKGNSKFQVTTPTAIASVRGTIMYLNVSPEATQAFFEAGQGALASLINGVMGTEKSVDPGQNAKADNTGAVSDPITTTPEQHQQLEGGFNSQEQAFNLASKDSAPGAMAEKTGIEQRGGGKENSNGMQQRLERNDGPANQEQRNADIFQGISVRPPSNFIPQVFTADIINGRFFFDYVEGGTNTTGQNRNSQNFFQTGTLTGSMVGVGSLTTAGTQNRQTSVFYAGAFTTGFAPNTQGVVWGFETSGFGVRGFSGGISEDGDAQGFSKFIFISPGQQTGIATGTLDGLFVGSGSSGAYFLSGDFTSIVKGTTQLSPQELHANLETTPLNNVGTGSGSFQSTGSMTVTSVKGTALGLKEENWGIVKLLLGGANTAANTTFSTSLAGKVDTTGNQAFDADAVFLGTFSGDWTSPDDIHGDIDVLWINEPDGDGFLEAGTIKGEAFGNATGNYGNWQATAVGEFNRTTATLQLSQVKTFIDTNAAQFNISQIAGLARNFAFQGGNFNAGAGSITGSANTTFYGSNGAGSTNGIWASIISGTFTGMPGSVTSWTANLQNASTTEAILTGVSWTGGNWLATVASNSNAAMAFTGQAGGTYTEAGGAGTFSGAGVGSWQEQVVG